MKAIPDTVLIVSVEATCWETPLEQPPKQHNEIVEVGYVPVSIRTLSIGKPLSLFVKPITSKISPFCTRITGITQAEVDKGFPFVEACQRLVNAGSLKFPWISFGDYDRVIFKHQCSAAKIAYPFCVGHWDFSTTFAKMLGLEHEVKLPIAMKLMGLDFKGTKHNSRDEVKNIARLMVETFGRVRGNNYDNKHTAKEETTKTNTTKTVC